ncbi:MAG: hypothetical protein PHV34_23520 [Verrucomicrobiae bacterium]|nr:hypothetical protein [Verrucomicrobiae bacterium]
MATLFFIVLGIILAMGLALFFIFRKTRLEKLSTPLSIPSRIQLTPDPNPKWKDQAKAEAAIQSFKDAGFQPAGTFLIPQMPGVLLFGLVKPEQQLVAVVYEHVKFGVWADVCLEYATDGKSLTVSNAPMKETADHAPGREKIFDKNLTVSELLEKTMAARLAEPCQPHGIEDFARFFEESYAKEKEWRSQSKAPPYPPDSSTETPAAAPKGGETVHEPAAAGPVAPPDAQTETIFPCQKEGAHECPFTFEKGSDREVMGMPIVEGDARTCPSCRHICPEFMETLGLTVEDLNIRAAIFCGRALEEMASRGEADPQAAEHVHLMERYREFTTRFPPGQHPRYYT